MYISGRQNTGDQYIVTTPILDMCLEEESWTVLQVVRRWWYQEGINFKGTQEDVDI